MTVSVGTFRQSFKEFSDPEDYTDFQINMHLTVAGIRLNASAWGTLLDTGTNLFVAHMLSIGKRNQLAAEAGAIPGELKGPATSKSVDRVAGTFATNEVMYKDAGFWNLTVYGNQFWDLAMMVGAGPMQIGVGPDIGGDFFPGFDGI